MCGRDWESFVFMMESLRKQKVPERNKICQDFLMGSLHATSSAIYWCAELALGSQKKEPQTHWPHPMHILPLVLRSQEYPFGRTNTKKVRHKGPVVEWPMKCGSAVERQPGSPVCQSETFWCFRAFLKLAEGTKSAGCPFPWSIWFWLLGSGQRIAAGRIRLRPWKRVSFHSGPIRQLPPCLHSKFLPPGR